jgi:N-acetylmuramoyl-L-alanine amidase
MSNNPLAKVKLWYNGNIIFARRTQRLRLRYLASLLLLLWLSCLPAWASAAPLDTVAKITGARWTRSVDATTGLIKVRLEVETTKPVEVERFITRLPNWRLIVTLQGTSIDKWAPGLSPDSVVVTQLSAVQSERNARLVVDFPEEVKAGQYKVSTLPADTKAKRPFRVVIDMERVVPVGNLKFLPGLKGKLVAIDPGHGGTDPGALGIRGSYEKKLNLDVAMLAKAKLEKAGAKVLMTRTTDVDVAGAKSTDREELSARAQVGNRNNADVFISVHHNSSVNPDASGTTTYFYAKTIFDGELARSLQVAMVKSGGLLDKGTRTANFFVVKNTVMPAALLEVGFMSNPQEEQTLNDPAFKDKIAQAIVDGLEQFFLQAAKMRGEQ